MHIDWVTEAYGPNGRYGNNEHVTDMIIKFTDSTGNFRKKVAYGPERAKILARWPRNTGDYTMRNADNLALFMTSQYVQSQLDNAYPQYPLINVDGPDVPPTTSNIYADLFLFDEDGTVTLNETNPLAAAFADEDDTECALDEDEPNPEPMVFTSFALNSAYPSDYIVTLESNLASETWAPDSVMTASPALNTSTPSTSDPYCFPFAGPDSGGAYYSFASGSDPCPYTSPGPASATIDPATVTGKIATPTPTSAAPVVGESCVPDACACSADNTNVLTCACELPDQPGGDATNCKWSSFAPCGGSATCHLSDANDSCDGFGACC